MNSSENAQYICIFKNVYFLPILYDVLSTSFRSSLLTLLFKLFISVYHKGITLSIILETCGRNMYFSDHSYGGSASVILSVQEFSGAKHS